MFTAKCVPSMYLFGTFSAQNASKTAPSSRPSRQLPGTRVRTRRAPRLHALGRAAVGWVAEYGHPAARDATEGGTPGKKRHSVPQGSRNNFTRIDLEQERGSLQVPSRVRDVTYSF